MRSIPRVMIAAPRSGGGKTIFTCGLLNLLKAEDAVGAFKCGPDFIDPMFHRTVIGVESENLDSFFSDDEELKGILGRSSAEMAVLEGVMGIYDGIGRGSCYEVATITQTPIILIMDGSGIWNTIVSLVKGIVMDDRAGLIKGIIFNRVSKKYCDTIAPLMDAMLKEIGSEARVLGFIPTSKNLSLESRHLGLKMPGEIEDLKDQVEGFSGLISENCDVKGILGIMESAPALQWEGEKGLDCENLNPLSLAVARDEAFCFYYGENLRRLKEAGMRIKEFSPLHDEKLPEGVQGILLGGGYPELYLDLLERNESMKESIREAIEGGMPSLAECGGFMYLAESIYDEEGVPKKMVGIVKGEARNTGKLTRFGYISLDGCGEGEALLPPGEKIKGHEFHYFDTDNNGEDCLAVKHSDDRSWKCVHQGRDHFWGYPHLYYGSDPEFVQRFKEAMEEYRRAHE